MIRLRPPIDSDVAAFFEHQRDPEANRMAAFGAKHPDDREAFVSRWQRQREDPTILMRAIEHDGEVVGHVASFLREDAREVTYWIDRAYWGKGIASAALGAFLRDEVRRPLFGRAAVDNLASRRVLEKHGFVIVGRERAFANARGEEIEEVVVRLG